MQDAETLPGTGGEAALAGGLLRLFQAAFLQSAAIAWLPVYVIPRRAPDPETQLDWVRNVWRQAAALPGCFEGDPPLPDCRLLRHGERSLAARVMALFEEDPALPALCLLGMDSPLGEAPENHAAAHPHKGQAPVPAPRISPIMGVLKTPSQGGTVAGLARRSARARAGKSTGIVFKIDLGRFQNRSRSILKSIETDFYVDRGRFLRRPRSIFTSTEVDFQAVSFRCPPPPKRPPR